MDSEDNITITGIRIAQLEDAIIELTTSPTITRNQRKRILVLVEFLLENTTVTHHSTRQDITSTAAPPHCQLSSPRSLATTSFMGATTSTNSIPTAQGYQNLPSGVISEPRRRFNLMEMLKASVDDKELINGPSV